MVRRSSKLGKFWLWSWIWPWQSRSIAPQNNRDLNQGLLHLWSKFGDPSLNGSQVIARTSKWLTHTHTRTHTQTQAMTIPEGQNWPRVIKWLFSSPFKPLRLTQQLALWRTEPGDFYVSGASSQQGTTTMHSRSHSVLGYGIPFYGRYRGCLPPSWPNSRL